jgi:hypothetical protein
MGEVIYLLRPLCSVAPTSNLLGHPRTIVYLEKGLKDHLLIIYQSVQHHFLCSVRLVTMLSHQLLSQLGATAVTDNLFLCRVLFLHREQTQELLPHQDLGILGRDQFPTKNFDLGKLFSQTMEPQTRYYAYAHGIGMGQPFPKSSKCNACSTIYILFWESSNEVSSHAESICWSWPWFLPEPRPAAKLLLATWCQSNSMSLFPWSSPTTQTTFSGNLAFSRLDKVVE